MISIPKKNEIRKLATNLRNALNMTQPPFDVENAVKILNGTVVFSDTFDCDTDAVIQKTGDNNFTISLNSSKPNHRSRFSIAHELGHLFLHMGYLLDPGKWNALSQDYSDSIFYRKADVRRQEEFEANEFAAEFLMPSDQFIIFSRSIISEGRVSLQPIADHFGVSTEAVKFRGKFLGVFQW